MYHVDVLLTDNSANNNDQKAHQISSASDCRICCYKRNIKHKGRCINLQLYQDQSLQLNIYVDDER